MEDSPIETDSSAQFDQSPSHITALADRIGSAAAEDNADEIDVGEELGGADDGDGRTLRRTRNRERVIEALLELIAEGHLEPNVGDIADRAGVSHRSVFRYFEDINDLVRLAIDHEVNAAMPLAVIPDLGVGSLDRRVDAWVESRLRVYARTHQVGRVARLRSASIPAIDASLAVLADLSRAQMRTHFATELDELGSDIEFVLDAAMLLTTFESYDLHRRLYGHGTERIRQVWHVGLAAIFVNSTARR